MALICTRAWPQQVVRALHEISFLFLNASLLKRFRARETWEHLFCACLETRERHMTRLSTCQFYEYEINFNRNQAEKKSHNPQKKKKRKIKKWKDSWTVSSKGNNFVFLSKCNCMHSGIGKSVRIFSIRGIYSKQMQLATGRTLILSGMWPIVLQVELLEI